jgi:hypothetical protein
MACFLPNDSAVTIAKIVRGDHLSIVAPSLMNPLERSFPGTADRTVPMGAERDVFRALRATERALHMRTTNQSRRIDAAQAHPHVPVVVLFRNGFVVVAGLQAHVGLLC